jgi:hypothetical protein
VNRREARLSEHVTGWAVNFLFPLPDLPNVYARFPWRRIRRTRGVICGALYVVKLLTPWSLELAWQIIWPADAPESQSENSGASRQFEID